MALVTRKPTAVPNVPATNIKTTTFNTIVADNTKRPVNSLLAYIDGSRWTTNAYYSQQVLGTSTPNQLDVGQQDTYQTFRKIVNFELRVTSPFDVSQDAESNSMSAEGTALVYPVLTPNVGDMFTAIAGRGYEGIFRVTEVTAKHFNLDSVYEIQFALFGIKDKNPNYFTDIEAKVVRTYIFRKDRLVAGLNPLITTEENNALLDLDKQFKQLVDHYFTLFYNTNYSCLLVPDKEKRVYDPYVPLFIRALLTSRDHVAMRDIKIYTLDGNRYASQKTIYDVLVERNKTLLPNVIRTYYLVSKQNFLSNGFLEGFRYQSVDYTVFPADLYGNELLEELSPLRFIDSSATIQNDIVPTPNIVKLMEQLTKETVIPLLPKIEDNYVVNGLFYTEGKVTSILEQLMLDYLNDKAVDLHALGKLIETARSWSYYNQFYYIPIVLFLIKAVGQQV